MLKLSAQAQDAYWIDLLPEVRVKVRPATIAAIIVARTEASKVFLADDENDDPQTGAKAAAALVGSLARFAIAEWEGIGDDDDDTPAPVTDENVDKLLTLWPAHRAFDETYVRPALAGQEEKNGSTKPPAGTSREGKTTAAPAA